jgi:hypothetical protein
VGGREEIILVLDDRVLTSRMVLNELISQWLSAGRSTSQHLLLIVTYGPAICLITSLPL